MHAHAHAHAHAHTYRRHTHGYRYRDIRRHAWDDIEGMDGYVKVVIVDWLSGDVVVVYSISIYRWIPSFFHFKLAIKQLSL